VVLLEKLKKRDEQPKDTPPTLLARSMCCGRMPTTRWPSLPAGFKLENGMVIVPAIEVAVVDKKADAKKITELEVKEEKAVNRCIFGTKRKFPSRQVLEDRRSRHMLMNFMRRGSVQQFVKSSPLFPWQQ
jgi:myosin V